MKSSTNKLHYGLANCTKESTRRIPWRVFSLFSAIGLLCALLLLQGAAQRPRRAQVYIRTLKNGHYQLMVERRPYIIKGVCYSPIPTGKNHEYNWWSDPAKPWIADGELMQKMGINTIRIYEPGEDPEAVKQVIRDLYERFGIRTILGHWLGFWEYPCPFYADDKFQERVAGEVLQMVELYKNEPGLLFWVLGNENNYSCLGHVNPWSSEEIDKEPDPAKQKAMRARIYYTFVNDIARRIKAADPDHPVALGNGELVGLDTAALVATDIDLVACIIYRGKTFGNLFNSLKATFDKPLYISEFGADAYDAYLGKEDQNMQAFFLESLWRQIYQNFAGNKDGAGNCLGGTMFEWTDEWWKHNEADPAGWGVHNTEAGWSNGSYYFDIKAKDNKNMNEEWFGIVALLPEETSAGIEKRQPRKSYYVIREFWKNPEAKRKKAKK